MVTTIIAGLGHSLLRFVLEVLIDRFLCVCFINVENLCSRKS